jgi:carbamoyl-phosphate synthase large subunit
MTEEKNIKRVLIIGSGPIIIGQAAEFDYSGTQGCRSLKEEGMYVILLNSNPATIMTDMDIADKVYIEPINTVTCEEIIKKEKPDGILPTLGGQTGLNLAVELYEKGILQKYGVKLLGTNVEAIENSEDREKFKNVMQQINEPIPPSEIVTTVEDALKFAETISYPVIVRPAYTLGGTGGGIANDIDDLKRIAYTGIKASMIGQILVEKSVAGYKEIEYEVMRDKNDNCITICNMENIDPVGVHTGDSIVVAPSQTLSDSQYQMLRSASINIIRSLKIEGGCNVQYALDPFTDNYFVIEVNPRVSRSSALASKVTGYPIAKVAAKIAIGKTLDEIQNPITKKTACFEPTLDYLVVKVPKWPFDKFTEADDTLGTQMKATGEVMAIDMTFEGAFMKALYSLEFKKSNIDFSEDLIEEKLTRPNSERIFWVMWALDLGYSIDYLYSKTKIDKWFLNKLLNISNIKSELDVYGYNFSHISDMDLDAQDSELYDLIKRAKKYGLSDSHIAMELKSAKKDIRNYRILNNIVPAYKMVDTCAAEFAANTPYHYSTYKEEDEVLVSDRPKVIILGSGPIRIGQGIEFDYCCVHSAWALKKLGIESIMINNNPETVSTDFDTSDKLYFEPLTLENVLNIVEKEKPLGVIAQFGGQTSLNLIKGLEANNVTVLGTSVNDMDTAEDREKFEKLLENLNIPKPYGETAMNREEAEEAIKKVGYPALLRPSYVIGGHSMVIVRNYDDFLWYIDNASKVSPAEPLLIDTYLEGKEVEIDGICDGENFLIVGLMEHIERAGVHSGDSMACYPHINISDELVNKIKVCSRKIALGLKIKGLINIQYIIKDNELYVLEVNPRASRTVPILSKVTGVNMINEGTICMLKNVPNIEKILNRKLDDSVFKKYTDVVPHPNFNIVKAPVFSSEKLKDANMTLGPQMKSTGEVMGIDKDFEIALLKAFKATNVKIPESGRVLISLKDKTEADELAKLYKALGFDIFATEGTAKSIESGFVDKIIDTNDLEYIEKAIKENEIAIVINTPKSGKDKDSFGSKIRMIATGFKIPCFTSTDTARAFQIAIKNIKNKTVVEYNSMHFYTTN